MQMALVRLQQSLAGALPREALDSLDCSMFYAGFSVEISGLSWFVNVFGLRFLLKLWIIWIPWVL